MRLVTLLLVVIKLLNIRLITVTSLLRYNCVKFVSKVN